MKFLSHSLLLTIICALFFSYTGVIAAINDPLLSSSTLEKPRFLWIDASANFPDFANSKENILRDLTLAKQAGFTDVVVDVRPSSGYVLFKTLKVEQVSWLGAWRNGVYTKISRSAQWDYLETFIDAGHSLGLRVYAGFNTFVGGQKNTLGTQGVLYSDQSKKDWATSLLTEDGIVNVMDQTANGTKFLNPVNESVQDYLIEILGDLAANYPLLDGIILDRGRFEGLTSDFSPYSRQKFEQYIGQSVSNFPADIMTSSITESSLPKVLPVYFKKWLEFRAKTTHDFMDKVRTRVKSENPSIKFGVYVGGWYATYFGTGVNWASKTYNTAEVYSKWATNEYKDFGYADLMDIILIGAYASPQNVYGTAEWTIQGFCSRAKEKIKNDALVVGGPDIGNGNWASSIDIPIYNQAIVSSVNAVTDVCDGYFLFDMIHLKNRNQWQYVHEGVYGYTLDGSVFVKWDDATGDIIIPERVDSIAPMVFKDNTNIISVYGANIKGIANEAFKGCASLSSIVMPQLINIGQSAFVVLP